MACERHRGYDEINCYQCSMARDRSLRDQRSLIEEQEKLRNRNDRRNAEIIAGGAITAAAMAHDADLERARLREERRLLEYQSSTPCPGACGMSIAMCRCLDLPCIGGCGKLGRNCECHLNVWCDTCENQKRNCHCPEPPVYRYTFMFTPIILAAWVAYLIFVPSSFWDSISFAPGPFFWMRVLFIGGVIALVVGSEMEANDNHWKSQWAAYENTIHMIKESAKRRRLGDPNNPPF